VNKRTGKKGAPKKYAGLVDVHNFNPNHFSLARSKNKLDFHFNAALTAVNLAKYDWLGTKGKENKPFSMSDYKSMYNNNLMLERFMSMFAINPNPPKNQKIVKELLDLRQNCRLKFTEVWYKL
jgi:hypothetical protein